MTDKQHMEETAAGLAGDVADLMARAAAWREEDPDPQTRAELDTLLSVASSNDKQAAACALDGLRDRFGTRLEFGTAGLRGALGAGPNRMNRVTVLRTAAGLVAWLRDQHIERLSAGVVVGYDARTNSDVFAMDTARVLAGAGVDVHLLQEPLPTPVLAFTALSMGAVAAVMVTASHNPPGDNGYKVYDHSARQIVPPADADISAAIDAVGPLSCVPMAGEDDSRIHRVGGEAVEAYISMAAATGRCQERDVQLVYTPMHGVGGRTALEVLARAGFARPAVVHAQFDPDPTFATVKYPNPEEPGALDLAFAEAQATGADLIVANDPDADRLGAAVADPTADGGFRMLTGDEIGALLAHHLFSTEPGGTEEGRDSSSAYSQPVVATTIVSSQLLGKMAFAAGLDYRETLTGFKWLTRAASEGPVFFAYEEALGYAVDPAVRDKDGITAMVLLAELAAVVKARGQTLRDVLDQLAVSHGVHATGQRSVRRDGKDGQAEIAWAVAAMRKNPPATLAKRVVTKVDDLTQHGGPQPPTDGVRLWLDRPDGSPGARVVIRPSGTEPKLKCYLEVIASVTGRTVTEARLAASRELADLGDAVVDALSFQA